MEIEEEQYRELFNRILRLKVDELMEEPYDDDMNDDDFWKDLTNSWLCGIYRLIPGVSQR